MTPKLSERSTQRTEVEMIRRSADRLGRRRRAPSPDTPIGCRLSTEGVIHTGRFKLSNFSFRVVFAHEINEIDGRNPRKRADSA
jgi:hypothetical protein